MRKRVAAAVLRLSLGIAAAICATATGAQAGDRHAGYYYPEPATREVYEARSERLPEANRATRIGFVTGIAKQISERPFPPQAVMFAKGTEAEKLIIVALVDGRIDTIYRARAVLANMTAAARKSAASSWPRHMYSVSVQVRRTRLQPSQKLWVIGVMKPSMWHRSRKVNQSCTPISRNAGSSRAAAVMLASTARAR